MQLVEKIKDLAHNYWKQQDIEQLSEDVCAYRRILLEYRSNAPILQLSQLEERARQLRARYLKSMYYGIFSSFSGLALFTLDSFYNLKPELFDKMATPIGVLLATAGMIHAFRSKNLIDDIKYMSSRIEDSTMILGSRDAPVN